MGYIPQHSLENLKKYQYKGVDKCVCFFFMSLFQADWYVFLCRSLVSRYVLNPFWTWFVTLWPHSVAPNTVRCVFKRRFSFN